MVAMMTACDPGDKVVIFSPFYENYTADAILSGATPIYVPLRAPDFRYDPDELRYPPVGVCVAVLLLIMRGFSRIGM